MRSSGRCTRATTSGRGSNGPRRCATAHPGALAQAREELADEILYRQYVQWVAQTQWAAAREAAHGIALFGDLPFMVSGDSADVWARQDEFRLDASVGVPPDAFSETGQDWGLPVYRWDVFAERDFDWLRARARRNAVLFDGYRVDHLVGFYRTYFRSNGGGGPQFTPAEQDEQTRLGERVLQVFREPGAEIIAEDLGVVPDFVRASLVRLSVPGYKVLRWERQWHTEGRPFKDPADYPAAGGGDLGHARYRADGHLVGGRACRGEGGRARDSFAACASRPVDEHMRDALIEMLMASGADLLILPIQDVFGWQDRINQPATVADSNWTWRLPWPVDALLTEAEAVAAARRLREWTERYGR